MTIGTVVKVSGSEVTIVIGSLQFSMEIEGHKVKEGDYVTIG